MTELHFPWIELSILVPLIGAIWVAQIKNLESAHKYCVAFCVVAFICTIGAWADFNIIGERAAHAPWDVLAQTLDRNLFVIDVFSAPLLPLAGLLHVLVVLTTSRTKLRRYSFSWALSSEVILLATLGCQEPWLIIALLAAGTVHPFAELKARGKPTRVFALHMGLFLVMLVTGWAALEWKPDEHAPWAMALLVCAVLIRSGIAPLHCWMTDLFEHATFGAALLFATPMLGAYAAVRLVLPIAPDWALSIIVFAATATAFYAAAMALAQREARRFFCYLFLSHSALVLVGLGVATPISMTAALSVWLSVALALGGFGLTIRSIEARTGRLSLADFHGLYDQMPTLAAFCLFTGMASVGFPGTFGFLGIEMLIDGAVQAWTAVGFVVVFAAALNGIAVLQTWLLMFGGKRHVSSVSLKCRRSEQLSMLVLAVLILGCGLYPQPGITSRKRAADEISGMRGEITTTAGTTDLRKPWNSLMPRATSQVTHRAAHPR